MQNPIATILVYFNCATFIQFGIIQFPKSGLESIKYVLNISREILHITQIRYV